MRWITLTLVALAAVTASVAGSAGASGGSATRDWFHGPFAEASWTTSSGGAVTCSGILASREQTGPNRGTTHLSLDQFTPTSGTCDNPTGGVDVSGETTLGVSFSIDTVKYTSASASGVVPLTRCTVDADRNPISCDDAGTLSVAADWTGQGPIPHQPGTGVFSFGGCLFVDHSSTVERDATAAVVLGGVPVEPSSPGFTGFGVGNGGLITVCPPA